MRKLCLLLIVTVAALCACSTQRTPIRSLTATLPAAGVQTIALDSKVGIVRFRPSVDGHIHVRAGLYSQHTSLFGLVTSTRGENAAKDASLDHTLTNGTLTLGMHYGANADSSALSEHWTVEMPASLAVNVHVAAGELDVNGIGGGVQATLDVGAVKLDVPGGSLKINTNVGKIDATVHNLGYGSVSLSSNVGKTALSVDGAPAGSHQKSGTRDALTWQGQGKQSIDLQVNVGKISAALLKP